MSTKRAEFMMIILALGALLLSACSQTGAQAAQANPPAPNRTITVVGQGKAAGAPNVAHINIGVETTGASAQEAMEANRVQMTALLEKIKAMGVAEKDVQTSNFSIYAEQTKPDVISLPSPSVGSVGDTIRYRVSNQVNVTVRDTTRLGDVLDGAVSAGANNIYGIYFEVSDTTTLEAAAREKAIADAKARAESLAKLNGVSVGDVLLVSEVIGSSVPYAYPRAAAAEGLGGGTPIQPGEFEVSVSVQVTYAMQ